MAYLQQVREQIQPVPPKSVIQVDSSITTMDTSIGKLEQYWPGYYEQDETYQVLKNLIQQDLMVFH